MKINTIFMLIACLFILSACGQREVMEPVTGQKATVTEEASYEEHLAFEREFTPIVEEEMRKRFPVTDPSVNPFEKFGTYYIDTSDKNKMKYVFLIDDEDAQEVKDLSAALKAKMGEHVEFRKSKHSQMELRAVQDEIAEILKNEKIVGGWGVGVDVFQEKVKVEAYLDEAAQSKLLSKFGSDVVEIKLFTTGIGIEGYVIEKKDDSILVVDPVKRDNQEGHVYAATWYTNAPSHIEIGNKVKVTVVNGVRPAILQYPDRDEALEVEVIQSSKLEGADLAEFEEVRDTVLSEIKG